MSCHLSLSLCLVIFLSSHGIWATLDGCERTVRWKDGEKEYPIMVHCDEEGNANELISNFITDLGAWEKKKFSQFSILAPLLSLDDGIVLDIGAHIGQFSLFLAGSLGAQVLAMEPYPANAALFRQSIALNGLEDRITVFENGLSDQTRETKAAVCPQNRGVVQVLSPGEEGREFWPSCCDWEKISRNSEPCDIVFFSLTTLDEVLLKYAGETRSLEQGVGAEDCRSTWPRPRVSLMKIDVEFHELAVLRGATGLLSDEKARPQVIFLEYHIPANLERCEEIAKILSGYGYLLFLNDNFQDGSTLLHLAPTKVLETLQYVLDLYKDEPSINIDLVAVTTSIARDPAFRRIGAGML